MKRLQRIGLLTLAVVTPLAGAQGPPANVRLDPVVEEIVAQQREATGQVVSLRRSAVATQEAGLVVELDLEPGDTVERGQVLARLDDNRARLEVGRWHARIEADKALLSQRRAELARAERDYTRIQQLAQRASAGESELDQAATEVESRKAQAMEAEANLRVSESEMALAQRRLDDMLIRAPFDGRVVSKQTEAGQWVSQGSSIVTIVSLKELEARADIPERSVGALQASRGSGQGGGGMIEVIVPALGKRLPGRLIEIVPEADSLSRLFPIRISVEDPDGLLRPGMSLTAVVPTGDSGPTLTISEDAILRNAAGEFVYFDAGGVAQVAPIVRLFSTGQRIAVRSPVLRPGSLVVVEGNERMYPSQALIVLNAEEFPEVAKRQAQSAAESAGRGG